MPWSGGTYTKWNQGTGGWAGDASLGTGIEPSRHDSQDNDFRDGINSCLNKNGQNNMTADLNLGGYRPTNVAAGTAAAPALCVANDTNTGLFQAAASPDTLSIATGGTERVRVNSTGQVGIGTTTPSWVVDVQSNSANTCGMQRFTSTGDGPFFTLIKSRSATVGTYTIVQSGDTLGTIAWGGANGTNYNDAAYIRAICDGTPGASNDMPGRLEFCTTPDGSSLPVERMRITSDGSTQLSGRLVFNTTTTASGTGIYAGAANVINFATNSASAGSIDASQFWYLAGSRNRTTAVAANCHIDSTDGGIFRSTSSLKYKTDVRDYDKGLESVLSLRPVYYKGKTNGDVEFAGLIAEEVDAAGLTEFVMYDEEGLPDALAYQNMIALLVNSVKELNAKVESLQAKITQLEAVTEV